MVTSPPALRISLLSSPPAQRRAAWYSGITVGNKDSIC
jgi:hypothetical protein